MNINFSEVKSEFNKTTNELFGQTKVQWDKVSQLFTRILPDFSCCFESELLEDTTPQLGQVPLPIQHHIFSYLTDQELQKLGLTSKYWHSMTSTYTLSTIISQDRIRDLPEIFLSSCIKKDGTDSNQNLLLKKTGATYSTRNIVEVLDLENLNGHRLCKGKDIWGRLFLAARYRLHSLGEGILVIQQEKPGNGFRWKFSSTGDAKLHLLNNWKTNAEIKAYMKKLLLFEKCGMPICRNYQFAEDSSAGTIEIAR